MTSSPPLVDSTDSLGLRWWKRPGSDIRLISGVFEGGGAKGVAYIGALEALRDRSCWFSGVAGSSAGAITATLIAAGLTAEQVRAELPKALACFYDPGRLWSRRLRGFNRLRVTTGYFDKSAFRTWLTGVLAEQPLVKSSNSDGAVTFQALHVASAIELNIVAADITRRQPIVFNYKTTPHCCVVEAVLASIALPCAFESADLKVHYSDIDALLIHTIVDGGVWANFPTFVFEDRSFRGFSGLPEKPEGEVTIGFILDEGIPSDHRAAVQGIRDFANPGEMYPAAERKADYRYWTGDEPGGSARVNQYERRWAYPKRIYWKTVTALLTNLSGVLRNPFAGLITLLIIYVFLGGGVLGARSIANPFQELADRNMENPVPEAALLVFLLWFLAALVWVLIWGVVVVAIFMVLVSTTIIFLVNAFFSKAGARIGLGLVTTYIGRPMAPAWAGHAEGDNVVRLQIPDQAISTLNFNIPPALVTLATTQAYRATDQALTRLFGR